MDFFFRILGVMARANERMSKFRVNFVPINLAVMFGLFAVAAAMGGTAMEARSNGRNPRPVSVGELSRNADNRANYVAARGILVPGLGLVSRRVRKNRYSGEQEDTGESQHYVVFAEDEKRGILVRMVTPPGEEDEPREATITGMVRLMDSDLSEKLAEEKGQVGPISVNQSYVLEEGEQPADPSLSLSVAGLAGLAWFLMFLTWCMRYVVFRRDPEPAFQSGASGWSFEDLQGACVGLTGLMLLDGEHQQRFLDVPAICTRLNTGEAAFASNIDASSRFMGITTSKRDGIWAASVRPRTVKSVETGTLYVGTAVLPALRFQYEEALMGGGHQTAVLTFETEAQRNHFIPALLGT